MKESPSLERFNGHGSTRNGSGVEAPSTPSSESSMRQRSFSDLPPLPPRNYNSQYRSDFHAKFSQPGPGRGQQGQAEQGGSHTNVARGQQGHSEQGSSRSNSRTNLSQDMDGSLLDLADELGDNEGRASSTSLHSGGSGSRRGHTDLGMGPGTGVALGHPQGVQNGGRSVSV